ncbi:hypothetical protein F6I34_05595 [Aerococcus tenax]|uniref:Uncharacterized protein n=1 Tax=Aerococcus tenax TaxID=3078812 RepID=A0A5N1BMZ9_9LACT|nr:hypothetical protein [Aerococcus urinae]KAA9239971.1 hypothetical protein F6I34_05595 [Aerococcus urinae]MDK6689724.1 hypothetical protein [Aerococcus urinae]
MNLNQLQTVENVRSTLKDSEVLSGVLFEDLKELWDEGDRFRYFSPEDIKLYALNCACVMENLFTLNRMVNENLFNSLNALDEIIEAEQDRLELEAEMAVPQGDEAPADL